MRHDGETIIVYLDSTGMVQEQIDIVSVDGGMVPIDKHGRPLVPVRLPVDEIRLILDKSDDGHVAEPELNILPLVRVILVGVIVGIGGYALSWVPVVLSGAGQWLNELGAAGKEFLTGLLSFVLYVLAPLLAVTSGLLYGLWALGGSGGGGTDEKPVSVPETGRSDISITTTTTVEWNKEQD